MTTDELVRLIEQDAASHRLHDCDEAHRHMAPIVTIGSLFQRAGCTRRAVEEAIQLARLEGVAIITDGGIRVAQTAAEATALGDWLDARMDSQRRTRDAVYAAALKLPGPVRPEATEQPTLGLVAA